MQSRVEWYGITDTEHSTTSGSNEVVSYLVILSLYEIDTT